MNTPETDAAVIASKGQWSFALKETCQRLERERDEARAERDKLKQLLAADSENVDAYLGVCVERDEAREKYATEATEHMLAINKICNESKKAREELANIESLMFGGLVQFTPKDGIAWRVFDAVMELKKERDEAREKAERYRLEANAMMLQRDEAREALREIAEASGFDNIGNWARNKAKSAIYR